MSPYTSLTYVYSSRPQAFHFISRPQGKTFQKQTTEKKMRNEAINVNTAKREFQNIEVLRKLKQGVISNDFKAYSGWGGLREAIYTPHIYRQLKSILNDAEINNIKETLGNAYFTPAPMVKAVYDVVKKLGFKGGSILEPAAGNGVFIENMPAEMRANSKITAVEIEQFSAKILNTLYPDVQVHQQGFETLNFGAEFDLIIGNPPYSSKTLFDPNHADLKDYKIHHYFMAKSFRLLKKGGILAMVLPSFCLDNLDCHVRDIIYKEGGRLLQAYRLPDNLFADAKVTIDLIFIVKDDQANQTPWQKAVKIDEVTGRIIYMNEYFVNHPQNVFGELKVIDAYKRKVLACQGDNSAYKKLAEKIAELKINETEPQDHFSSLIKEIDAKILALQTRKQQVLKLQHELKTF